MDNNNLLYKYLLLQLHRLLGNVKEDIITKAIHHYIFDRIEDTELMSVYRKYKVIQFPQALENETILWYTLKTIGIMEASKDWKQFQELEKQRQFNTDIEDDKGKEITDFDRILQAMMKVPKPKDEELKNEKEQ